jgi:HAD superfamily hydrolase (TIGR01450 family)
MQKPLDWSKKRCVVLDMDGTVYLGHIPIEGAVDFITKHWNDLDFYFLSNNTSKSPNSYIEKLNGMGIPARRELMLSPVTPLVDFLRANKIHSAYIVGNDDFRRDLKSRMPELEMGEKNARAVILAYDTELTYEKLSRSALMLQKPEVLFLATHPDLVCPSPEGPLPDVGSMIELYNTATGRRPQHIFGKPDPAVLAPLLARYDKKDMIMVGDRLSTDKKLAENAGIDFALVLSGEATREDLAREASQPAVVLEDLGKAFWVGK